MEIKPRQLEIIEATGKILTESGVNGLTIKKLANEMKFSESAIYRHFDSKEEILLTMLKYLNGNITQILKSLTATPDVETDFRTVFKRITTYFQENPYYVVVIFSEGLLDESKKVRDAIMSLIYLMMNRMRSIIQRGQQSGKFIDSITADELAQIVLATYKQQMFTWRFQNFEFNIKDSIETIVSTLLDILKNHSRKASQN